MDETPTDPADKVIRFEIDEASTVDENGRKLPVMKAGGVNWSIQAYTSDKKESEEESFVISLSAVVNENSSWSVDLDADCIIRHPNTGASLKDSHTLRHHPKGLEKGFFCFPYAKLFEEENVNEGKGFIQKRFDSMAVEIRLRESKGIKCKPLVVVDTPVEDPEAILSEKWDDVPDVTSSFDHIYRPLPPQFAKPKQPTSDPFDVLAEKALAELPPGIFADFENLSNPRVGATLSNRQTPSGVVRWCAARDPVGPVQWSEDHCFPDLKKLPIYSHRDKILEKISNARVILILAPCGTGKSLIAPALLAEMLREEAASGKRSGSRRGLTICPSAGHGKGIAKEALKLYMNPLALCGIFNFVNPFERITVESLQREYKEKGVDLSSLPGAPKHAITNYRGGLMVLNNSGPDLKLLHIDEIHSTASELRDLLALSRRELVSGNVQKLLLTTATMEKKEIEELRSYFYEMHLEFAVVDLSDDMKTPFLLTMSCAQLKEGQNIAPFENTSYANRVNKKIELKHEELREQRCYGGHNFGAEEDEEVPEMNSMESYVMLAIDGAMGENTEKLEAKEKKEEIAMLSTLVHVPGKELADRIRSSIEGKLFDDSRTTYEFFLYMTTGKPGFILERLRSETLLSGVNGRKKREEYYYMMKLLSLLRITYKSDDRHKWEALMKELGDPIGPWGGKKGRIILSTPQMAEGITLKDVSIVIDPGVMRIPGPYSPTGLRYLELTWIDKKQLFQRAGRAARTCEGEYFLCVSGQKAEQILKSDIMPKLLERNFDEVSWIRSKQLGVFEELIWKPPVDLTNKFMQSWSIRGLWKEGRFTREALQLYSYFHFLTPDLTRFVVTGVRLGLAAHVICYAAEFISSHKLSGRPTKIQENQRKISDEAAYELYVNVCALAEGSWADKIRPFDAGDSVAIADMLVTWVRHTFPPVVPQDPRKPKPIRPVLNVELEPNFHKYESYTNAKWTEMEQLAAESPDGYFWSGRWCPSEEDEAKGEVMGMKKLQHVFIRDEGRDSICVEIRRIARACQRLDIISSDDPLDGRGSFLSPRFNRHLRGKDNYNLNEDGRALFRALLTMSSDKIANSNTSNGPSDVTFDIHTGEHICPDRFDWMKREKDSPAVLVRYWDTFKATHSYRFIGCLDPISQMQAVFFLNTFGKVENDDDNYNIKIHLNASPNECPNGITRFDNGISIPTDEELSDRVWTVRKSLVRSVTRITTEKYKTFEDVASAIIRLWKALDDGTEKNAEISTAWKEKSDKMLLGTPGYGRHSRRDRVDGWGSGGW